MVAPNRMDKLVQLVLEDAEQAVRRERDQALNESRRLIQEAEDRAEELRQAALSLGRVRGAAVDQAEVEAAERELAGIEAAAFEALGERFLRRVRLLLEGLPETPEYAAALASWARQVASRCQGALEVFTGRRDRGAVYEALLAAGVADFHVRLDARVHVGFIVRDLDGRTLLDRRPEALVLERRHELIEMLRAAAPPFAGLPPGSPESAPPQDRTALEGASRAGSGPEV